MASVALVDCNNFYASCERAFNPKLEGKPILVLSNNDGCVIARSNEVKALGIPMGEPWFRIEKEAQRHGIQVFSSNHELYGDMSARVMRILGRFSPHQEIYSIDECFLGLEGFEQDLRSYAQGIRDKVKRCTGIPVSIGIASTKTLAKLANHVAKKRSGFEGVCDFGLFSPSDLSFLLSNIEASEVWGIGRRTARKLATMGITTVQDLKSANPRWIRQQFSVTVERTVAELNGIACIELEEDSPGKQQIISSRSFGKPVRTFQDLSEAICSYASRAAEKLRSQEAVAGSIGVFLMTNPFKPNEPQYHPSQLVPLATPTDDTRLLAQAALKGLKCIYKQAYAYKKAGVTLLAIQQKSDKPATLFDDLQAESKSARLMHVMDLINRKMGQDTLKIAGAGVEQPWRMRRFLKSPNYTTCWKEILRIM